MNLKARQLVFIHAHSSSLSSVSAFIQSDTFSFKPGMEYDPRKSEDLAFFGNNQAKIR